MMLLRRGLLKAVRVRRHWKLILVVATVYCVLWIWVQTGLLGRLDGYPVLSFISKRVYDPFGSATRRHCGAGLLHPTFGALGARLTTSSVAEPRVCYHGDAPGTTADIQMESEWESIGVGYPDLVLTVTGWVDTIKVDSWTPKPLTVIVLPHSHQDPGWRETFEGYYQSSSRYTLSLVVDKLTNNPAWRFVWAEVAFLQLWWNAATTAQKERFKRLLDNGQLEIVTGGWVMPDEATVHYEAMLDQLTEGHLWLTDTLGLTVNNSWAIDPFGHSPTMTYLIGQAGMKNMVIQRTHFAVKRHFAYLKNLEFHWTQAWDRGRSTSVFCHMMPFLSYSIPHSCGPDRHVCCKFDFSRNKCFYGKTALKVETVTDQNVAQLSGELWEQLQKKSELFRSDVVLMPHGDDFRYSDGGEWDIQLGNLERIMSYINSNSDMNMKMKFGTLADYFTALHTSHKGPDHRAYPRLSGDFFPYSDRSDQYWSGFYTTRPYYKRLIRRLQYMLRSTEILYTFALSKVRMTDQTRRTYDRLVAIRRASALMQHHDAITGTSTRTVVPSYLRSIQEAMTSSRLAQEETLRSILTDADWYRKHFPDHVVVNLTESYEQDNEGAARKMIDVRKQRLVVVWNPLGVTQNHVVTLLVNNTHVVVADDTGTRVRFQLSPVFDDQTEIVAGKYLLAFEVTVPPLSLSIYKLSPASAPPTNTLVNITLYNMDASDTGSFQPFKAAHSTATKFHCANEYLNATFTSCDGMLKFTKYFKEEDSYRSEMYFATYSTGRNTHPFRDKSGAYIFLPDGTAKMLNTGKPRIMVLSGGLFTQVYSVAKNIVHTVTLYNVTGPLGKGLLVENVVRINDAAWNNRELALRLETDVAGSQHTFCHDLNGFQLHRRQTRHKLDIQGNFYPMTTMAVLDGDSRRVTLLTTEAHGVASLVSGWLEVMLDRRMVQDDWSGLGQGVADNRPTRSTFFLMFERTLPNVKVFSHDHMCLPSADASHVSDVINNPPITFSLDKIDAQKNQVTSPKTFLSTPLPCGLHMVNFKYIRSPQKGPSSSAKEAMLVVHMKGTDCGFSVTGNLCSNQNGLLPGNLGIQIESIEEMNISGVQVKAARAVGDVINIDQVEIKTYKITFK